MIEESIKIIEDTMSLIKGKDYSLSFGVRALYKFELELFLCLEMVRYELLASHEVTELGRGLGYLFSVPIFEFYYRDYPDIYSQCGVLFKNLKQYNAKMRDDELLPLQAKNSNRKKYFNSIISKIIGEK